MGLFRRGKVWYLDYCAGARRVRERAGLSKGEADRAPTIRQAEIALGKFNLVPKTSVPSFELFADRYSNLVSVHKRGCATERYIIQALTGFFGRRILELDEEACRLQSCALATPLFRRRSSAEHRHAPGRAVIPLLGATRPHPSDDTHLGRKDEFWRTQHSAEYDCKRSDFRPRASEEFGVGFSKPSKRRGRGF